MKVSVIISTYNREASLAQTLHALRYQTHRPFEVVVINGPSTDDTEQLLARFGDGIKVGRSAGLNLGRARNAGVALVDGDVVAFLDDDAVPDPRWLEGLAAGYDGERVAAVGGYVHDGTGLIPDPGGATARARSGQSYTNLRPPFWGYTLPRPDRFLHLPGTNVSFRRRLLEEVGGFDEEIEYHLGEADVCLRLADRGFELRLVAGALVYHRTLPDRVRGPQGELRQPRPLIKDRTYFTLRARPAEVSVEALQEHCDEVAQQILGEARAQNALSADELASFTEEVDRGLWLGIARGLHGPRRLAPRPASRPGPFRPFPALSPEPYPLTLCLVGGGAASEDGDAATDFDKELAHALAARGHEIHYLTRSSDRECIDFEDGVWVHRVLPEPDGPWYTSELKPGVKDKLAHAAAVHRAVRRLGQSRFLDLVSVPLWDCAGLYCLLDAELTCVLTLRGSPPGTDRGPMPMRPLEQLAFRSARHVLALRRGDLDAARSEYGNPAAGAEVHIACSGGGEHVEAGQLADHVLGAYTEILNRRKAA